LCNGWIFSWQCTSRIFLAFPQKFHQFSSLSCIPLEPFRFALGSIQISLDSPWNSWMQSWCFWRHSFSCDSEAHWRIPVTQQWAPLYFLRILRGVCFDLLGDFEEVFIFHLNLIVPLVFDHQMHLDQLHNNSYYCHSLLSLPLSLHGNIRNYLKCSVIRRILGFNKEHCYFMK